MNTWVSLDGTDGAGKSTLSSQLRHILPGYTVLERDYTCQNLEKTRSGVRLQQLQKSIFDYHHTEPVWEHLLVIGFILYVRPIGCSTMKSFQKYTGAY